MFFKRTRFVFVLAFLLITFISVIGIFLSEQSSFVHAVGVRQSTEALSGRVAHIQPSITLYSVSGGLPGQSNPGGRIRVFGSGFHANER
ncbi:MAG TPA: hypothetical protein VII61_16315, partial [Ktedonobacteraceae bacterium]